MSSRIRMTQLHEKLFMRGHTKGSNTERMLSALQDRKITMVLNVAIINDPALHAAMGCIGMEYIHEPLRDSFTTPFNEATVRSLIKTVVRTVEHGNGVLVHCDSGRNRSGLVVVPVLAELTRRPVAVLLDEVRAKRPISRGVLDNPRFRNWVLRYEPECDCMDCSIAGEATH